MKANYLSLGVARNSFIGDSSHFVGIGDEEGSYGITEFGSVGSQGTWSQHEGSQAIARERKVTLSATVFLGEGKIVFTVECEGNTTNHELVDLNFGDEGVFPAISLTAHTEVKVLEIMPL
jgi:hypothetical protein